MSAPKPASESTARFKIDTSRSRWWNYAVYQKSWFGWWAEVFQSDLISRCEDHIIELQKLPRYYE